MIYQLSLIGRVLTARRLRQPSHEAERLTTNVSLYSEIPKTATFSSLYRPSLTLTTKQIIRLQQGKRVYIVWFWPNEATWTLATALNAAALAGIISSGLTSIAPIFVAALLTLLAFAASSARLLPSDAPLLRLWLIYLCGTGLALPSCVLWWPEVPRWSRFATLFIALIGLLWVLFLTLVSMVIAFLEEYDRRQAEQRGRQQPAQE